MPKLIPNNQSLLELAPAEKHGLADEVAQQLFQAIMTGKIMQGQRINEAKIAQALQVSRAPVREAIMQLSKQGLITRIANRGAFVISLSQRDVEEIWSLRSVLEQFAITKLITHATTETFLALHALVREMREVPLSEEGDQRLAALDLGFHEALITATKHTRLLNAWVTLCNQTQLLLYSSIHQQHDPAGITQGHEDILAALEQRDAAMAYRVLEGHLNASYTFLRQLYAENAIPQAS